VFRSLRRLRDLGERLRHHDEVTGQLGKRIRWKRLGPGFLIPASSINRRQLRPQIDDPDVHESAASLPRVEFSRGDEPSPNPRPLVCRIDSEEAEVGPVLSQFHVDASDQGSGDLGEDELSARQHLVNRRGIGAVPPDEKTLGGAKRGVDHTDDRPYVRDRPDSSEGGSWGWQVSPRRCRRGPLQPSRHILSARGGSWRRCPCDSGVASALVTASTCSHQCEVCGAA
jgi:hypothetical protein